MEPISPASPVQPPKRGRRPKGEKSLVYFGCRVQEETDKEIRRRAHDAEVSHGAVIDQAIKDTTR